MQLRSTFLSICLLGVVLTFSAWPITSLKAQETKINFYLKSLIDGAEAGETIHLMVRGDVPKIRTEVESRGGLFKYQFRNYASLTIPLDEIAGLAQQSFVERLDIAMGKGQPLNDRLLINNNVIPVHNGIAPLPEAYTGAGVVYGVIDAGLELQHPDFHYPNGNTRVIEIWDHTMGFDPARTPSYGYGQVWDSSEINAGICPHQDQFLSYGHGTNVTGIGASNGLATNNFKGVAPDAELVIVSTNFGLNNWAITIAEAVDYICHVADSLGKPCVINASVGNYMGPHDGKDVATQMIEDILDEQPGRIMVCAAGNSGNVEPYHLGYNVTSDTNFTWFESENFLILGYGGVFFEIWSDTNDFNNVLFAIGADKVTGGYEFRGNTPFDGISNRLNTLVADTLKSFDNNILGIVQTYAEEVDGRYFMQVVLAQPDSSQYLYRLMTTGQGRVDVWSKQYVTSQWVGTSDIVSTNLPDSTIFPDIVHYKIPDLEQSIVDNWACSPKVVTVGNYANRDNYIDIDGNLQTFSNLAGNIADDSSWGPNRKGNVKPEVAAPGEITLTAGKYSQLATIMAVSSLRWRMSQDSLHNRAGGTSMASPGVAGIAALFLQKCPTGTYADFIQALTSTGKQDAFTGTVPNVRWGYGKADAFAALTSTNFISPIIAPTADICEGESLTMILDNSLATYLWNTGDSTNTITADTSGLFYAALVDTRGCEGTSDSLLLTVHPNPDPPALVVTDTNVLCAGQTATLSLPNTFGAYDWSNGTHVNSITVSTAGDYWVKVSDAYCSAFSDTVTIEVLDAPAVPTISDVNGVLFSSLVPTASYRWFLNGQLIAGANDVFYEPLQSGVYKVEAFFDNGCANVSSEYQVFFTGLVEQSEGVGLRIYPNPTDGKVYLETMGQSQAFFNVKMMNALGVSFHSSVWTPASNTDQLQLDLSEQPSGIYFLQITSGKTMTVHKIVNR